MTNQEPEFTPELRISTFREENASEQRGVLPTTRGDRAEEFPWRITRWPAENEAET